MPAATPPKNKNIIIKKVKKGDHGSAHGGAWKVAYADFVTAMMAFFLLLWLISMVSDEKKARVAEYFREYTVFSIFEKGGGALSPGASRAILESSAAESSSKYGRDETKQLPMERSADKEAELPGQVEETEAARVAKAEKMKSELRQAVEQRLGDMKDQVLVDNFEGGVRIQVMDKASNLMFPLGSTSLTEHAQTALKVIADRLNSFEGKIALEGHTDALTYPTEQYTNWELSTGRASAARQLLARFGLPPERIIRVAGYADTDPLIKDNPYDPRNRRISILIYDKSH